MICQLQELIFSDYAARLQNIEKQRVKYTRKAKKSECFSYSELKHIRNNWFGTLPLEFHGTVKHVLATLGGKRQLSESLKIQSTGKNTPVDGEAYRYGYGMGYPLGYEEGIKASGQLKKRAYKTPDVNVRQCNNCYNEWVRKGKKRSTASKNAFPKDFKTGYRAGYKHGYDTTPNKHQNMLAMVLRDLEKRVRNDIDASKEQGREMMNLLDQFIYCRSFRVGNRVQFYDDDYENGESGVGGTVTAVPTADDWNYMVTHMITPVIGVQWDDKTRNNEEKPYNLVNLSRQG